MKVYIVYQKFIKDVKRKNSNCLSAKKNELRFIKAYATKQAADKSAADIKKIFLQEAEVLVKEIEIN